jgi:glutamate decarboxylase
MPPAIEDMAVLRIVVRNGFGRNLADDLMEDLALVIKRLEGRRHLTTEERTGFAH